MLLPFSPLRPLFPRFQLSFDLVSIPKLLFLFLGLLWTLNFVLLQILLCNIPIIPRFLAVREIPEFWFMQSIAVNIDCLNSNCRVLVFVDVFFLQINRRLNSVVF